jgi:hypothetical protein
MGQRELPSSGADAGHTIIKRYGRPPWCWGSRAKKRVRPEHARESRISNISPLIEMKAICGRFFSISSRETAMKKNEFLKAVDTLKLYRRAELVDEIGQELISDLYVDPLPDNHVLRTVLRPNTTFLIGRKGTGKSTIFQMAQESLTNDKYATWAYIDIKTLYESSTA